MTGWQVLGWVLLADVGLLTVCITAGLGRIFWQAGDTSEKSPSIFKGKKHE